jgi:outer membrane lipoprotein-sorting protein
MNGRILRVAVVAGLMVLGVTEGLWAQEAPGVDEIVAKANRAAYYQGKDGRAQVSMTITDRQGRTREREFIILRSDVEPADATGEAPDGAQKFYVYFTKPADVNKQAFLVWKHVGKDDDRWLYLPALNLVKRIAASDERTSFVGSNFFYEDVSGRGLEEDTHELIETTANYYVVKNKPVKPEAVEFSEYTVYIHKATFLPVKIEYLDKNGEKYRVYEALAVETVDGFPTVTKSRMQDLKGGGETTLSYSSVKYNVGLPDDIFTERYLQNAPRQYLR